LLLLAAPAERQVSTVKAMAVMLYYKVVPQGLTDYLA
jgi:hypothetical protein